MNEEFEKAFGDFLETREYDNASDVLFFLVRTAFLAGWQAAKGGPVRRTAPVLRPNFKTEKESNKR